MSQYVELGKQGWRRTGGYGDIREAQFWVKRFQKSGRDTKVVKTSDRQNVFGYRYDVYVKDKT